MTNSNETAPTVTEVLERLGRCVELVSMDPYCDGITIGLHEKDGLLTVWSFSRKEGVHARLRQVRNQLVTLGGLSPVHRTDTLANFPCGYIHSRPLKFLMMRAVEKSPDFRWPDGPISVKDLKSGLTFLAERRQEGRKWVYEIRGEGEAKNPQLRLRSAAAGMVRYGEMKKVGDTEVSFVCGYPHDELVRLLFPYARNLSGTDDMLEADALHGQLTTGTLGFTPQ